jgi:hypothetical protein
MIVVWIKIDTWVIEKMTLEEGTVGRDGMRDKRGMRCEGCKVVGL